MAPANVTDSDVLAIWKRLQKKRRRVIKAKYSVGQHVHISNEKAKFTKSSEHNFSTEIFRIVKVIPRTPCPVYELEDLNKQPIEGQFYPEELTPVVVTKQTQFKIDKIIGTRVRRGIKEHKVRWLCYGPEFDSWVKASKLLNFETRLWKSSKTTFTLRCSVPPQLTNILGIHKLHSRIV